NRARQQPGAARLRSVVEKVQPEERHAARDQGQPAPPLAGHKQSGAERGGEQDGRRFPSEKRGSQERAPDSKPPDRNPGRLLVACSALGTRRRLGACSALDAVCWFALWSELAAG